MASAARNTEITFCTLMTTNFLLEVF